MEAICKADYDLRVQLCKQAEKENERRKKEAEEAERVKRRAAARGNSSKQKTNEPKISSPEEDEQEQEVVVLKVGFNDIYGVWFFGLLTETIRHIAKKRFKVELHKMMHVYVDEDPQKLPDGIHNIFVYGNPCILYKWTAQGYHRGLVVLADDDSGNAKAQIYMASGTWSWLMNDEDSKRLEAISTGRLSGQQHDQLR